MDEACTRWQSEVRAKLDLEHGYFGDYCNLSVYLQRQVAKLTPPLPNSLSEGLLDVRLDHYKHYNRLARSFAKQLIYWALHEIEGLHNE